MWLLKTEPGDYNYDALEKAGRARWDGVRNPAAIRNHLYRARTALREAMVAADAAPTQALASVDDLDVWARTVGS